MSASGAGEAPLIAGKIHGVRGWSLSGATLGAAVQGDEWAADGKATRATCRNQRRHKSPVKECGCGLYGTHPWAGGTQGEILGVIEAWGRVELHAGGFRAERARPIALFVVADETTLAEVRVLHQVAERYECELIELAGTRRDRGGVPSSRLGPGARGRGRAGAGDAKRRRRRRNPGAPDAAGRGERIVEGLEMAFVGAISLAYAAFWGVIGSRGHRRDHGLASARVGRGRRGRARARPRAGSEDRRRGDRPAGRQSAAGLRRRAQEPPGGRPRSGHGRS